MFGLAIFVTVSQLPKLFGLKKGSGDTIRQFAHLVANLGNTSLTTLRGRAAGAGAAVRARTVSCPASRAGWSCSSSASPSAPRSTCPTTGWPPWARSLPGCPRWRGRTSRLSELWVLLPSAVGMMLVIFSEALGAGQTFADKHGYRLDSSQEMIALGLANIGSGLLGGLACGGSLSQTAVNDGAGARTRALARWWPPCSA